MRQHPKIVLTVRAFDWLRLGCSSDAVSQAQLATVTTTSGMSRVPDRLQATMYGGGNAIQAGDTEAGATNSM